MTSAAPLYRIGAVARITGISTHQLRIWERRYNTVEPVRSQGGDRLYSEADVARLKKLKHLSDAGHSIGRIAKLSDEDLTRLAERHHPPGPAPLEDANLAESVTTQFLDAIARMDIMEAERAISRGSLTFEPRDFTMRVLIPALHEVGRRWEDGDFSVAHEHAASAALRTQLGVLIRLYSSDPSAPVAVCATPAGELHELGALAAALTTAARGWRIVYLGPNLPAADMVQAVTLSHAKLLLLSIVRASSETAAELLTLAHSLPEYTSLLVGGQGASQLQGLPPRARLVTSLTQLNAML